MSAISLSKGSIGYSDRAVVREVDLRVDAGEVVALVGPNGSGKTTLVRGLLGLARLTGGRLELFGTPADAFDDRARIGYVPQRHTVGGAIPSTVTEVVGSGRLPRKRWSSWLNAADRAAIESAVETVGLGEFARADVAALSGGQQRRVLIARALASEPDLLIMDEPTAGVDAAAQRMLAATLGRLVEAGLTLLIVTHEIGPLRPVLTRVVAMEHGRIRYDGPVQGAPSPAPDGHHHAEPAPGPIWGT